MLAISQKLYACIRYIHIFLRAKHIYYLFLSVTFTQKVFLIQHVNIWKYFPSPKRIQPHVRLLEVSKCV